MNNIYLIHPYFVLISVSSPLHLIILFLIFISNDNIPFRARRGGVVRRPLAMGGTTPRIYYYMTHHYRGQTPNTVDKTNPVATTSRGQGYVDDDLDQGVDNGAGVFPRPSSSFETGETPRSSKGSEIDRGEDQEQEQDSDNGESETTSSGYSEKIINGTELHFRGC
jgi:hypothetical protein